jgi:hypothetical protein
MLTKQYLWNQHPSTHGNQQICTLGLLVCSLSSPAPPKAIAISIHVFAGATAATRWRGERGCLSAPLDHSSAQLLFHARCTDRMAPTSSPLAFRAQVVCWSQESKPMPIRVGHLRAHLERATPTPTPTTVTPTASDGDADGDLLLGLDRRSSGRTWQRLKLRVHAWTVTWTRYSLAYVSRPTLANMCRSMMTMHAIQGSKPKFDRAALPACCNHLLTDDYCLLIACIYAFQSRMNSARSRTTVPWRTILCHADSSHT